MAGWLYFAKQSIRPSEPLLNLASLLFEEGGILDKMELEVGDEVYWFLDEKTGAIGFANDSIDQIDNLNGVPAAEYQPTKDQFEDLSLGEKERRKGKTITNPSGTPVVPISDPFFKGSENEVPEKVKLDNGDSVCFVVKEEGMEARDIDDGKYCYLVREDRLYEVVTKWVNTQENTQRLLRDDIDVAAGIHNLSDQNFEELDPSTFDEHPGSPVDAWLTGFDWEHIVEGYPLEREYPAQDEEERRSVTNEIVQDLYDGRNLVVLGGPASGKSTICKKVAYRWHRDRGSVLYRESDTFKPFEHPVPLIQAINDAEDDTLVVVEDAVTGAADPIFKVIDQFENDSGVAFLLDARNTAWDNAYNLTDEAEINTVQVPGFDTTECQRAINHYKEITGKEEVGITSERLYKEVRSSDISKILTLAYRLAGPPIGEEDEEPGSGFKADIWNIFDNLTEWPENDNLVCSVGVTVNILNAANLPVTPPLIHALASSHEDHQIIDRTLEQLMGTILVSGDEKQYRTPHEFLSALYLERLLTKPEHERLGADIFQECINALFDLLENPGRRKQIVEERIDEPPELFTFLDSDPQTVSDQFVRQLVAIGRKYPTLAPLYRTSEKSRICLPTACSDEARLYWLNQRGFMHLDRADLDAAEQKFTKVKELVDTQEEIEMDQSKREAWRSHILNNLGAVAQHRGNIEQAQKYHEKSLAIEREVGGQHTRPKGVNNSGLLTKNLEDLDQDQADVFDELEEQLSGSRALRGLARCAYIGHLENAKEYIEESIDDLPEDDTVNRIKSYVTASGVLGYYADHEETSVSIDDISQQSQCYLEQARKLSEENDYRPGIALSIQNLGALKGQIGKKNDNKERLREAEEHFQESLRLFTDLGKRYHMAECYANLGAIYSELGEWDQAETHLRRALEIFDEEFSSPRDVARVKLNLGSYYHDRIVDEMENDDVDIEEIEEYMNESEQHLREALELFEELGADRLIQKIEDMIEDLDNWNEEYFQDPAGSSQ